MSYNDRTVRVLTAREHYAADSSLVIRQRWDENQTTFQIRRVILPNGTEELQIEVSIEKFGKRTTQMSSSFVLPPRIADLMAAACSQVRELN
jgi:hypothetical protein